jgi:hypothetical protein
MSAALQRLCIWSYVWHSQLSQLQSTTCAFSVASMWRSEHAADTQALLPCSCSTVLSVPKVGVASNFGHDAATHNHSFTPCMPLAAALASPLHSEAQPVILSLSLDWHPLAEALTSYGSCMLQAPRVTKLNLGRSKLA